MSSGNHLVIDEFIRRSQMAGQAFGAAVLEVARVVHAELNRLLVRPIFCSVRTQPSRGRTVTVLATHPFGQLERLRLLVWGNVKCMAGQAFRRFRRRPNIQNRANVLGNLVLEHTVSSRVLVLGNPDCVFVLENSRCGLGLDAAMATAGGAATRAVVFAGGNRFLRIKAGRSGSLRIAHGKQHEQRPGGREQWLPHFAVSSHQGAESHFDRVGRLYDESAKESTKSHADFPPAMGK